MYEEAPGFRLGPRAVTRTQAREDPKGVSHHEGARRAYEWVFIGLQITGTLNGAIAVVDMTSPLTEGYAALCLCECVCIHLKHRTGSYMEREVLPRV